MEPRSYSGQPAAVFRRSPATLPTRCVTMVSEHQSVVATSTHGGDLGGVTRSRDRESIYTDDRRSSRSSILSSFDDGSGVGFSKNQRDVLQHRRIDGQRSKNQEPDLHFQANEKWKARLHADEEEWRARYLVDDERWKFRMRVLKKMMDIGLPAMDNDRWAKFQEERRRLLELSSKKRADDNGALPRTPRCPQTVRSNVPGMLPKHKEAYYTLVAAQSPARATRFMVQVDGPTAVRLSTINDSSNRSRLVCEGVDPKGNFSIPNLNLSFARSLTAASSLVEGPLLSSDAPKVKCSRPVRQNVQQKLLVLGQTLTAEFRGLIRKENTREVVVVNLEKSARKSFHCAKYTIKDNATLMSGNEPGLSVIQSIRKKKIGGLPVEVSFCTVMSAIDFPSGGVIGNANCMLNMVLEPLPISVLFPLKPPPEPPPLPAGPVVPTCQFSCNSLIGQHRISASVRYRKWGCSSRTRPSR